MDPGEGSGTPESFTSAESGRMAADFQSTGEGQFWVENGSLWLKLPGKPKSFKAPDPDNMIFTGWDYANGTSRPGFAYIITSDLTLTAQWAEDGNARLLSLTPSSGTLGREFDPYCLSYDLVVPYTGSSVSVTVEAVAQDPGATVEYSLGEDFKDSFYTCPAMTADGDDVYIRVTNGANKEIYRVTLSFLYTLTLTTEGQGTAIAVWDDEEIYTGSNGVVRTLKATPAAGWKFKEWQLVSGGGSLRYPNSQNFGEYRFGSDNAVVKAVFEPLPTYA